MGGRATVPGVSRIAVARPIMASRACEGKLAVRQIMPWIYLRSRPSGPSADGTYPFAAIARTRSARYCLHHAIPRCLRGENIRVTLSYQPSAARADPGIRLARSRFCVVWCPEEDSNLHDLAIAST